MPRVLNHPIRFYEWTHTLIPWSNSSINAYSSDILDNHCHKISWILPINLFQNDSSLCWILTIRIFICICLGCIGIKDPWDNSYLNVYVVTNIKSFVHQYFVSTLPFFMQISRKQMIITQTKFIHLLNIFFFQWWALE